MLIKRPDDIRSSEITDKQLYLNRREFIRATTSTAAAVATVVRRRKAKQTPKQRAVNAWRRTTKSVRKRVKR